jgi:general secretion pathway protein D
MTTKRLQLMKILTCILGFCLCAALETHAQAQRTTGSASSTSRPYVPNGTIGDAVISADTDTKQITVIADEETARYIRQVIKGLDRPKPQVLIKVVFLEVTYNNTSDIGVEGSITRKLSSPLTGMASNVFGAGSIGTVPPGAGLFTILGNDFQATLRAISQAGKTEILSRPSILTRNNQQATISIGQQVPLITGTRIDTQNNQINTFSYQKVGVNLQVTPFITPEGMVEMILAPSISQLADKSQWVPTSSGPAGTVLSPVINSRSADTVVVVPDGQTVVIGGLMETDKIGSDSKIPILGDIPLIGILFKRQAKNYTKTELIIFLTPHIVNAPEQLAGLSASERANSALTPKAFTEQELDRFLDTVPVKGTKTPVGNAPKNSNKANANSQPSTSQK